MTQPKILFMKKDKGQPQTLTKTSRSSGPNWRFVYDPQTSNGNEMSIKNSESWNKSVAAF